jgi:hypothetical protein
VAGAIVAVILKSFLSLGKISKNIKYFPAKRNLSDVRQAKIGEQKMFSPGSHKAKRTFPEFSGGLRTAGQFILATWLAVVILIGFAVATGDNSYGKCVGS